LEYCYIILGAGSLIIIIIIVRLFLTRRNTTKTLQGRAVLYNVIWIVVVKITFLRYTICRRHLTPPSACTHVPQVYITPSPSQLYNMYKFVLSTSLQFQNTAPDRITDGMTEMNIASGAYLSSESIKCCL